MLENKNALSFKQLFVLWCSGCIAASYILHTYLAMPQVVGIFQAANALMLIGFGYYVFKTNALSVIKETMTRLHQQQQLLRNQADDLNNRKHLLANTTAGQQIVMDDLASKVIIWRDTWVKNCDQKKDAFSQMNQRLEKKRTIQSHYATLEGTRRAVLDKAVNQAQHELVAQFAHEAKARPFLNTIVAYIEGKNNEHKN